jgi:serine protease Do
MLDNKKWKIPIAIAIFAIGGGVIKMLISANITNPIRQSSPIVVEDRDSKIATTTELNYPTVAKLAAAVTVRILTDGAPGSGVTIARNHKTYTVLTCQHVVADTKKDRHRVLLPDGKIYPAKVKFTPKFKGLDLALVEFKSSHNYQVVKLGNSGQLLADSSVYAAGFPNYQTIDSERIEQTITWGREAFRLTSGKVGSISPQNLPEGYSLGYTNEVTSGMSGGPVFNNKGELVGINGRLKYPVQGIDAFTFADGTKPSVETFERMEALSWAIPIAKIEYSNPN